MGSEEHISFERLLEHVEGAPTPDQAQALEQLLSDMDMESRRRDLRWLRAFQTASERIVLASPGADLHAALVAQFRPSPLGRAIRQIAAMLTFDSAAQPALASMRSAVSQARQLIFDCDMVEIALNIRPSRQSDQLDLSGQLFPRQIVDVAGFVVRLSRGPDLVDVVLTNTVGEFQFAALPPGSYSLALSNDADQVAVDSLTLQLVA